MKNRKKIMLLIAVFFSNLLSAEECQYQISDYEWIEGKDVMVREDGIYIDTNKGLMPINVVDYDKENDRYLVKCTPLEHGPQTVEILYDHSRKEIGP